MAESEGKAQYASEGCERQTPVGYPGARTLEDTLVFCTI